MNKLQKILTISLWVLLVVAMVSLLASGMLRRAPQPAASATGFFVPVFSMTDQNAKPFPGDALKGKVWIADFIFTDCPGPCKTMSQNMAQLQKQLAGTGVRLVSFSVDPERDTPAVLKKYGEQFGQDENVWTLLTGELNAIYQLAFAMKISAQPASVDGNIIHSSKLVLVDRDGQIFNWFSGETQEGVNAAADAARALIRGKEAGPRK